MSTDINKELTNEPSTEQSTNIRSESITKVETTKYIPIQKTEMHEYVTGYYDTTTTNYIPTDVEATQQKSSTIEVGSTIGRQLQTTTVPMTSHSEDKTPIVQHRFSSEISTSPKYETTFGSDRTINIEFTTGDKTMDSGGFTTEPKKISSTAGQLKTTIPSHWTTKPKSTTWYKTEKYVKFPITRHYASKMTRSTSTQHNSVIGEKQSDKSFPLISKFI